MQLLIFQVMDSLLENTNNTVAYAAAYIFLIVSSCEILKPAFPCNT